MIPPPQDYVGCVKSGVIDPIECTDFASVYGLSIIPLFSCVNFWNHTAFNFMKLTFYSNRIGNFGP
jgi:hypothetical protein